VVLAKRIISFTNTTPAFGHPSSAEEGSPGSHPESDT
jgi:hypothetical protein